ncbi:MAG TPA: hypothetical protein VF771_08780 [Longimicrobiaceae bacterium]
MKKIRLDVDELHVESFQLQDELAGEMTVRAYAASEIAGVDSCDSCGPTYCATCPAGCVPQTSIPQTGFEG